METILFTTSDMAGSRSAELVRLVRRLAGDPEPPHHFLLLQDVAIEQAKQVTAVASPRTRILHVPQRCALSKARNLLIAAAMAEGVLGSEGLVGFPDDDAFYPSQLLADLRRLFAREPDVDLVACRCHPQPNDRLDTARLRPARISELVRLATSNTIFLRSRLVRQLGAFDEELGLGTPAQGGEDTEYVLRAALAGRRSLMCDQPLVGHPIPTPEAAVRYYHGATVSIARHAKRRPAVAGELVRKLAVGGWHALHGRLTPKAALSAWAHALRAGMQGPRPHPLPAMTVAPSTRPPAPAAQPQSQPIRREDTPERLCILLATDNRYLVPTAVTVGSLLATNAHHDIDVHIAAFDRDRVRSDQLFGPLFTRFTRARLHFQDLEPSLFDGLPTTAQLPKASYVRLLLDRLVPSERERILYLDTDILVRGDLGELWRSPLDGCVLGAVPDHFLFDPAQVGFGLDEPYFNAGVMLVDRVRWRAEQCETRVLDCIARHGRKLSLPDQDALNIVLRGRIKSLQLTYNFQPRCADVPAEMLGLLPAELARVRAQPAIVHYTTRFKPWNASFRVHYSDRYLAVAREVVPADQLPAEVSPITFGEHMMAVKTRLRWQFPRAFRIVRRLAKPRQAALMYRAPADG